MRLPDEGDDSIGISLIDYLKTMRTKKPTPFGGTKKKIFHLVATVVDPKR